MPSVDPADRAKEIETALVVSSDIKIIMHKDNAFIGVGFLLVKKANMATYVINAARRAEIGIAEHTR